MVVDMQEEKVVWNIGRKEGIEELKNHRPPCFMPAKPSDGKSESERKDWVVGLLVRVRPEVENVLRLFAEKTGWLPHSVRNVSILLGLLALARDQASFPENIGQYEKLVKKVMEAIERMGYGKEKSEEDSK
jgi:hypothetical protein